MEIKSLSDVVHAFGWDGNEKSGVFARIVSKIEERLKKRLPHGKDVSLTSLQKKALNHEAFRENWADENGEPRHLIIQGATSAGKTLLSELSIVDVLSHSYKAIVLVPLKAMVHERTGQFKDDLEKQKYGYRVYGSSSDYMDNDENLIGGEYEVAVIVYEKFFAMLSQGNAKILENCKLVVVDELSMLSKEERGPKLELALEMIRSRSPKTRIMCLATSDCSAEIIARWLGEETVVIHSPLRPVGLDEYIIRPDGTGRCRHIPSELECGGVEPDEERMQKLMHPEDVTLEIVGYRRDLREREQKEKFLLAVIRRIYDRNPDAKTLIFVATKSDSERYARFLVQQAPDLFHPVDTDEDFDKAIADIEACDADDDRDSLKELLKKGIAYHNSGVSTNLREIIEMEFQRIESPVRAIVATETLTIGVNMPFDAMIMMDSRVPKGVGEKQPLNNQEYRNYIGRAGRLGQSNQTGETYLFVRTDKEFAFYWDGFYGAPAEIGSALTAVDECGRAPYFLGLLTDYKKKEFAKEEIADLYDRSLSKVFEEGKREFHADEILDNLDNAYLAEQVVQRLRGKRARGASDAVQYELSAFGKNMAPYALSMDTCISIYNYFVDGEENNGMKLGITQQEIESDIFLLETLYHICRHPEIERSSNLMLLENRNTDGTFRSVLAVKSKLQKMLEEKDREGNPVHRLWEENENNELYQIWKCSNLTSQQEKLQAAMRAILIYYWTKGKSIREIKKETGFDSFVKIISGDTERLAEMISFHLDAIFNCLRNAISGSGMVFADETALSEFYTLQTRVKYGMEKELVVLANKHVHGLDRSRLLEFGRFAKERGCTPLELLMTLSDSQLKKYKFMTPSQRNSLLQQIERRHSNRNANFSQFGVLLASIKKDMGAEFPSELEENLQAIFEWDGKSESELIELLTNVLDCTDQVRNQRFFRNFRAIKRGNDLPACFEWSASFRKQRGEMVDDDLRVAVLTNEVSENVKNGIKSYLGQEGKWEGTTVRARILITTEEYSTQLLEELGGYFDAAMSCKFFAIILTQAIAKQGNCEIALLSFLMDAYGIFTRDVPFEFSLSNYIGQERNEAEQPAFRLLCSLGVDSYDTLDATDLKNALSNTEDISNYEVLPWGYELRRLMEEVDLTTCPIVVFLERTHMIHSKSLTKLLYLMKNQKYEYCTAVFGSEEARSSWDAGNSIYDEHALNWVSQNNQIPRKLVSDVASAVDAIREIRSAYVHKDFLIGISYAHYSETPDYPQSCCDSDIQKLEKLAAMLKEEYGEHRVLFDQYWPAHSFFMEPEAPQRSLDAYRQCQIYLILSNWWTFHNSNCRREIEVIKEQYRRGKASYLYLTTGSPASESVGKEFTSPLDDTESILRFIRAHIRGEESENS